MIELVREGADAFEVRCVRLDSGDLGALVREAGQMLDRAGLGEVEIFASGGLDEGAIRDLVAGGVAAGAPGVSHPERLLRASGRGAHPESGPAPNVALGSASSLEPDRARTDQRSQLLALLLVQQLVELS